MPGGPEVEHQRVPLHVADVGMHDRRERHQSQALREPRIIAQAVPIRCDRQVNECWVAVRDGLIKAVERFIGCEWLVVARIKPDLRR